MQEKFMYTQFDEKGKIFTNIVNKKKLKAIIQTISGRVEGFIYIRSDGRLSDELNRSDAFIPVTDATIFDENNEKWKEVSFIAIRFSQIVWVVPVEEETTKEKE
jgi:hypothetical protein